MDDYFEVEEQERPNVEFIITDEFRNALDVAEHTNQHLFITGDAGTGKSTWLKYFRQQTKKKCVTIAPTGIAAVNVGGQTMHSFFKWPPRQLSPADIKILEDNEIFNEIEMIIIDEISMVRVDQMDFINDFLQMNRSDDSPFGGVQMVLIGDLLQLPPVTKQDMEELRLFERYGCEYFFAADIWQFTELKLIKFTRIFRQVDAVFISILNRMRDSTISYAEIDKLNEHRYTKEDEDKSAFLCAKNDAADRINKDRIDKLSGTLYTYSMIAQGLTSGLAKYIPEVLSVKVGAKIMMLVNDQAGRWQNGTVGHVVECGQHTILVNIYGYEYWINRHKWEIARHKLDRDNQVMTTVDGTVEQFPFKVAYAISIHKSQGQTFDSIIIDLGTKAFAPGMSYCAVSRCKTLEGVFFATPLRMSDIYFDKSVLEYLKVGKYVRK